MSELVGLFRYGSESIAYEVHASPRRKTLGIEVHPDLRVIVRAPTDCDPGAIDMRVRRRAKWISHQLQHFRRFSPRTPPRRYVGGETHLYLGRQYLLKVVSDDRNSVKLGRGDLVVAVSGKPNSDRVKVLLDSWYREHARSVFFSVLEHSFQYFRKRGHELPRVTVRAMHRRWGSLSPTRAMTLNSNLVRAPKSCIEYVIVHELCHLIHRLHGPSFYRLLTQLVPDWQKRKARLEEALL